MKNSTIFAIILGFVGLFAMLISSLLTIGGGIGILMGLAIFFFGVLIFIAPLIWIALAKLGLMERWETFREQKRAWDSPAIRNNLDVTREEQNLSTLTANAGGMWKILRRELVHAYPNVPRETPLNQIIVPLKNKNCYFAMVDKEKMGTLKDVVFGMELSNSLWRYNFEVNTFKEFLNMYREGLLDIEQKAPPFPLKGFESEVTLRREL